MIEETEEDFTNGVETMVRQIMSEAHHAIPGTVKAVSSTGRSITASPVLSKILADGRVLPSPLIYNVPFVWPRTMAGKAGLTMPIAVGDGVLLIMTDRSLESWLTNGEPVPDDPRQYHLSDAVAIPGLYHFGINLPQQDVNSVVLFYDKASITMKQNGVMVLHAVEIQTDTNIVSSADVVASGVSLKNHAHGEVESGNDMTGPPQ